MMLESHDSRELHASFHYNCREIPEICSSHNRLHARQPNTDRDTTYMSPSRAASIVTAEGTMLKGCCSITAEGDSRKHGAGQWWHLRGGGGRGPGDRRLLR